MIRYLTGPPVAAERIYVYLVRYGDQAQIPVAISSYYAAKRPVPGWPAGRHGVVTRWASAAQGHVDGLGVHGLLATAATSALKLDADIAKAQAGSAMPTSALPGYMIGVNNGHPRFLKDLPSECLMCHLGP